MRVGVMIFVGGVVNVGKGVRKVKARLRLSYM